MFVSVVDDRGEAASRAGQIDALEAELAEVAGILNAAQGRLVALVADGLAQGLWQQAGVSSATQWLTWQLGISSTQARRILALARRAPELPATLGALGRGELSFDQAGVVARHVPAAHETAAVDLARHTTVAQLTRTLARYAYQPPDPDRVTADSEPGEERRRVSFASRDDGSWTLHAELPADQGAVVETALAAAHHQLFTQATGTPDTGRVTWADALVAVAETSLAAREVTLPGPDRYLVLTHLEADPADPTNPARLSVHLDRPLPDTLRRYLTCDTRLRPVAHLDGKPVSVGRTMRTVPRRTRRLVEHRDGGCAVPGCETTRHLHIHHITHWEDHGPSDTPNLVALCGRHHRQHHLGALTITGDADLPRPHPKGLRFHDARGRPIGPAARPRPPGHLPPPPHPYQHPTGEPLDPHWLVL